MFRLEFLIIHNKNNYNNICLINCIKSKQEPKFYIVHNEKLDGKLMLEDSMCQYIRKMVLINGCS
jgi:hypothetical protein